MSVPTAGFCVVCCALLLALSPALAAADQEDVPIEISGRVIFVKGVVNGQEPMTFILDTGATETVLTPPAAKRLGIEGITVSAGQKKGIVLSLSVGNATVRNFQVFIFDPPQALPLRLNQGRDYSGILGYTFLSRFVTSLDYRRRRVRFTPLALEPNWREPVTAAVEAGVHVMPFRVRRGLIHVTGQVNGKGPFDFLIDTGSSEVLLLPRVAAALNLTTTESAATPKVRFARLDLLSVGTATVSNVSAVVHDLPLERPGPSYDGIVGHPFLSRFRVTIDYRARRLSLDPDDEARSPAERPAMAR